MSKRKSSPQRESRRDPRVSVPRIIRCSRCGRSRFVQPEDGVATCKECLAVVPRAEITVAVMIEHRPPITYSPQITIEDRPPIEFHPVITIEDRPPIEYRLKVRIEKGNENG